MSGGQITISTHDEQTIIAQCTPSGRGALALLRISGTFACQIATQMSNLNSGKKLSDFLSHTIHYGSVIDSDQSVIDHVLFLLMRAPNSFTGQDTVEITCHNNPFIIESIIARAIACGARLAQEGEFSRRAFLNGKIDLLQAESINELIHSQTNMGLKKSLAQVQGSLSSWITSIEQDLLTALAYCEASFEFLDEEVEFKTEINEKINHLLLVLERIKTTFNQQQHIKEGIRIALLGSVNAGKSSLFNALLEKDRAIVTPIAGTTRDSIEASMYRDGIYWTLIDTAGLRMTNDLIEQEGIERSLAEAEKADIILLTFDGSRALSEQEYISYSGLIIRFSQKVILVQTKSDLELVETIFDKKDITSLSSKSKKEVAGLMSMLQARVRKIMKDHDVPYILNQRQYNLLLNLEHELLQIKELTSCQDVAYELLAHHLRSSLEQLTQLTGKSIDAVTLDTIFKKFCVGK